MALLLDTETTGLSYNDEILSIAIIDDTGRVLLDTLVKPDKKTVWPDAQLINGISPEMLADALPLSHYLPRVIELVRSEDVFIYNRDYDCQYLPVRDYARSVHCLMLMFARYYGEWDDYRQSYRWQRLGFAASQFGYSPPPDLRLHSALGDCFAALAVYRGLLPHVDWQK